MKAVIVGAGISGLATAHTLLQTHPDLDLEVLESAQRPGGKIFTDRTAEGFLCESGVNAFLDNKPATLALAAVLGLEPVVSNDEARLRYVYSDKRLQLLPTSPPAFLTSDLLSLSGRLRVMAETLVPRARRSDESLAQFAIRRLGREAFEKLIDPMASGVFAGDATRLSLRSSFPRVYAVEKEYRSLIIGLIKMQLKARMQGLSDRPTAGPGGRLSSFAQGMSALPDALASALGHRLRLGAPVEAISMEGGRFGVLLLDGSFIGADRLILAAPAYAQAGMLRQCLPELSTLLDEIQYPPLAVCCLGYRREKIAHGLKGFGFLVPSREKRDILGTLWDSSIFPGRAPAGYVLLRTMIGGARAAKLALLPEGKLVDAVRRELSGIMGIDATPDFVRIYRHERSIPQYNVGHQRRLEAIADILRQWPKLTLTGNAFRGVSLNDCIANAQPGAVLAPGVF